ncbi:MAG: VapC toxin family PIN domain ribonuclease [Polaromonas sp.]|nr:VapC toxin family PIN domain ribonuclease [Polaromonas sp.]
MVLIDSSVWVSFLQSGGEPKLVQLLDLQEALMHEMVLGEVAMGSKEQRKSALELLPLLPTVQVASHSEVMTLVDKHQLYGKGVGYVDVHLLTAVVLQPGVQLWSRDKRLRAAAEQLGVAF